MRKTQLPDQILAVFRASQGPITVAQLREKLKQKGISPNKTTIYRQLDTLVGEGKIHEISLHSGGLHYEIHSAHHHHFVCDTCDKVSCLHDDALEVAIHNVQEKIAQDNVVIDHHFHISGLCQQCK